MRSLNELTSAGRPALWCTVLAAGLIAGTGAGLAGCDQSSTPSTPTTPVSSNSTSGDDTNSTTEMKSAAADAASDSDAALKARVAELEGRLEKREEQLGKAVDRLTSLPKPRVTAAGAAGEISAPGVVDGSEGTELNRQRNRVAGAADDALDTIAQKKEALRERLGDATADARTAATSTGAKMPVATQPGNEKAAQIALEQELSENDGASSIVVVEPTTLDLGEIPTGDSGAGMVRLVNTGAEARTVLDCKTSCGCTTANCQKGKVLEPGEEMEVEVKLDGGAQPRKLSKTVTFLVSGQQPLKMTVQGESVSYVVVEPNLLDSKLHPDGRIVLRSIDDTPFSVKSMYPPIITEFSDEKKTKHEIMIPWDEFAEKGLRQRRLLFALDHPKCPKTYAQISSATIVATTPANPNQPGDRPADDLRVAPNTTKVNLDRLLKNDQIDRALTLIEDGTIDVASVDSTGKTPLTLAAQAGNVDVILALLDASADVEATDSTGRTPLMYAAQSKNVEAVRSLLDAGANSRARDQIGNTPLCWAAGFGDAATVNELVEAGAGIDTPGTATGFTPLIWASGFGEADSVKYLIEAGANLEATDAFEKATPLMYAARTNRKDNVTALLEGGANLEARDAQGKTTILMAASNSGADAEMLEMLVAAGADITVKNDAGQNALDLAKKRTDVRAEAVVKYLESKLAGDDAE